MVHKTKTGFGRTELLSKPICTSALVPHAGETSRGVEQIEIGNRPFAIRVELEVVSISRTGRLPTGTNLIHLIGSNLREIETSLNSQLREPSIVFKSAEAFFRHSKQKFAIANKTSRRIVRLRIVNTESDHSDVEPSSQVMQNKRSDSLLSRHQVYPGDARSWRADLKLKVLCGDKSGYLGEPPRCEQVISVLFDIPFRS